MGKLLGNFYGFLAIKPIYGLHGQLDGGILAWQRLKYRVVYSQGHL